MRPIVNFELMEGDRKGMIRTGIEHNYSRIAEFNHPMHVPLRYRDGLSGLGFTGGKLSRSRLQHVWDSPFIYTLTPEGCVPIVR